MLALHSLGSSSPRPSPDGTGTAGRLVEPDALRRDSGKAPPPIRSAVSEPSLRRFFVAAPLRGATLLKRPLARRIVNLPEIQTADFPF